MAYTVAAVLAVSLLSVGHASIVPQKLLVFYGWPSTINGYYNNTAAMLEYSKYDYVIFGDGVEHSTHGDHANTAWIMDNLPSTTKVCGYIDLGVTTQNLPLTTIQTYVNEWQAMGASAIFFDDFGYDFQTSRSRQNSAIDMVHTAGMDVIANAWVPGDALSSAYDATYNPLSTATHLTTSDAYFFESLQVTTGVLMTESAWQSKANDLLTYQNDPLDIHVMAVTTNDATNAFSQAYFDYAWYSALLYEYEAFGWGEYLFSSSTSSAPYRTRPSVNPGTQYTDIVTGSNHYYHAPTDLGTVYVNCTSATGGFIASKR